MSANDGTQENPAAGGGAPNTGVIRVEKGKQPVRPTGEELEEEGIDPNLDNPTVEVDELTDSDATTNPADSSDISADELLTVEQAGAKRLAKKKAKAERKAARLAIKAVQQNNLKRKATTDDLRAANFKVPRTDTDMGRFPHITGSTVTPKDIVQSLQAQIRLFEARYAAVIERRDKVVPVGPTPNTQKLSSVVHSLEGVLDELVALSGELVAGFRSVKVLSMLQQVQSRGRLLDREEFETKINDIEAQLHNHVDDTGRRLRALNQGSDNPALGSTANANPTSSGPQTPSSRGINLSGLKSALKTDAELRAIVLGIFNDPTNLNNSGPVAGPSGTSNQSANPPAPTHSSHVSPDKRSRTRTNTKWSYACHYAVKELIGMRGTWDGDSISEPGYLPDGEWPSHEEDDEDTGLPGPQQIDVELAMGGTRSVWRPEWKKIGEERWSPFVNEVAARVVNTWKMTNGDRPTVNDLKPLIIKYCKNRSGVRPTSAEEGGVHLARLVNRKRGHISDDRYKIWPQSPPNLCRKAPVYALLRAPLFSPTLWQCDDRQNRRFPVLQQPANQPALIETDSWKVWRRYSFGGNAALADGCYELNWPYWLSDECIAAASYLDAMSEEKNRNQPLYRTRWVSPRRMWPQTDPKTEELRAPLAGDPTRPDPAATGAIVYRSMVRPQTAAIWAAQKPALWALIYPDPPVPASHAERPTLEELVNGPNALAEHKQTWARSTQLRACQVPDKTNAEILALAVEYAVADAAALEAQAEALTGALAA
ncbi:hypothetical protein HD553DRAFT_342371 [Filobasidium floriforme]|uniref:uncharacterized protein n=1 Tax=Filobasidium floriforme TaxID=5210 RepID=UPI001E8CC61B|nr:uncharacterized protein HD553DRAFT_342371 [Filobasidium floriforme]KAH8084851.1 hypothetical protein HD553DRAFT_342371 [Filobasidium floriforme]